MGARHKSELLCDVGQVGSPVVGRLAIGRSLPSCPTPTLRFHPFLPVNRVGVNFHVAQRENLKSRRAPGGFLKLGAGKQVRQLRFQ